MLIKNIVKWTGLWLFAGLLERRLHDIMDHPAQADIVFFSWADKDGVFYAGVTFTCMLTRINYLLCAGDAGGPQFFFDPSGGEFNTIPPLDREDLYYNLYVDACGKLTRIDQKAGDIAGEIRQPYIRQEEGG